MSDDRTCLTTVEAARYLRVSPRTLVRWRNSRVGPPWTEVGRRIVYLQSDLRNYLSCRRFDPAQLRTHTGAPPRP